jgi:PAS domain-containing protein
MAGPGSGAPRPLELILARNLLSSLSTPAFLVDQAGDIVFYNEGASTLLGRRFEDGGPMKAAEWTSTFGPFEADGKPIPFEQLKLTQALRGNKPAHARFAIRSLAGVRHLIEASALPIVGAEGFHGAIVVFWPVVDGDNGA